MTKFSIVAAIAFLVTGCLSTKPHYKKPFELVVQFNSFCCGVPDEEPIRDVIHQVLVEEDVSGIIGWKLSPMGKEGEYWICFQSDRSFNSIKPRLTEALTELVKKPQETGSITLDSNLMLNQINLPIQAKWSSQWFE
jgi:hypothetical protein